MQGLIQVENVSKSFGSLKGSHIHAVETTSLEVHDGEFISLIGPSGCGKSTLLKMIGGLTLPTTGSIDVKGEKLVGPARNVGFVFQTPTLFPWLTVMQNVLMPFVIAGKRKKDYVARAEELLNMTGLHGFEDRYPFELSGGMQQRVSITRALVHDPAILLMDEPFGALDAITREQMGLELLKIWERLRITTVFVTHDISEAVFLADKVAVMTPRPGKIREIVEIAIPRPRNIRTKEQEDFISYSRMVKTLLGLE